jgi:hypothetical protein
VALALEEEQFSVVREINTDYLVNLLPPSPHPKYFILFLPSLIFIFYLSFS